MARGRSRSKVADEVEATEPVDTTQEAAEEQAPQDTEENTVTVTEPEVEATEPEVEATEPEVAEPAQSEDAQPEAEASASDSNEGAQPEAKAEAAAPTPKELESAFYERCEEAVVNSDDTTGSVPEMYSSKVLEAYAALPSGTVKSTVKNWLGEEMRNALIGANGNPPDVHRARALSDINATVLAASARRSAAAPARPAKSPTEVYLDSILTLDMAKQFVARPKEDELDANWQEQYNQRYSDYTAEGGPFAQYLTWLNAAEAERGDEPDVDQVIKNAAKVAAGKATSGRKSGGTRKTGGSTGGPRRNVGAHIEEFLAQADPNAEYTVAEVANYNSSEYGDDHPSPGAVAARLFPNTGKPSTIQGFEHIAGSEPKKIRKI